MAKGSGGSGRTGGGGGTGGKGAAGAQFGSVSTGYDKNGLRGAWTLDEKGRLIRLPLDKGQQEDIMAYIRLKAQVKDWTAARMAEFNRGERMNLHASRPWRR